MTIRWLLAALHLLALAIGFSSVLFRASALRRVQEPGALRRVFAADAWWGVAALLWLATGLARLFMQSEKPTAFYLQFPMFWVKMALFVGIVLMEIRPAVALTRWRGRARRGEEPDLTHAPVLARISCFQAGVVVAIVFAATAMARGIGP